MRVSTEPIQRMLSCGTMAPAYTCHLGFSSQHAKSTSLGFHSMIKDGMLHAFHPSNFCLLSLFDSNFENLHWNGNIYLNSEMVSPWRVDIKYHKFDFLMFVIAIIEIWKLDIRWISGLLNLHIKQNDDSIIHGEFIYSSIYNYKMKLVATSAVS